jgi:hypothetical protein
MSEVPLQWQYQRCQPISPKRSNDKGNEKRKDPLRARAHRLFNPRRCREILASRERQLENGNRQANWSTLGVIMIPCRFSKPRFSLLFSFLVSFALFLSRNWHRMNRADDWRDTLAILIAARRLQVCLSLIELESLRLVVGLPSSISVSSVIPTL